MLTQALDNEVSHIQLTHPDFRANNDMKYYISDADKSAAKISEIEGVEAVCSRLVINGMANSASKSQGVQVNGIVPEQDMKVFKLTMKVYPGSGGYFSEGKTEGYALYWR